WQAGDTEAAFEHFGRRFDDLHTEVALMEHRLESGTGDARKIKSAAAALAETLPEAHVLGDVDGFAARVARLVKQADQTHHCKRAGARQGKGALCERAEELSGSTDWGATSAAFRDLLVEWKAAGRAAKDVDDTLWQRFKAAQDVFFSARNAASSERDAEFRA